MIAGTPLHAGAAQGLLLRLDDALSFWGGLDPSTGTIIDRSHPQHGERLGGRVVAMPGSRGSSGTPGVLGEALRAGVGPAGLIVTKADINLVAGATVAAALYGCACPVVLVASSDFGLLIDGEATRVDPDGSIVQGASAS